MGDKRISKATGEDIWYKKGDRRKKYSKGDRRGDIE
jgi:hypothetical protein